MTAATLRPIGLVARSAGLLVVILLQITGCMNDGAKHEEVLVFAAASLTDAVSEVADDFEGVYGDRVRVHVAATSTLARQIEAGAPADLFLAAHPEWMEALQKAGLLHGAPIDFLSNQLVFVTTSTSDAETAVAGISSIDRLALGDPAHVPAGAYAVEALERCGIVQEVLDRWIPTLDVRAALAAVLSGAADGAVVYATDVAIADRPIRSLAFPDTCQPEIRYVAALTASGAASESARRLFDFLLSGETRSVWKKYGFTALTSPEKEDANIP